MMQKRGKFRVLPQAAFRTAAFVLTSVANDEIISYPIDPIFNRSEGGESPHRKLRWRSKVVFFVTSPASI
jgi:hypothetical protein